MGGSIPATFRDRYEDLGVNGTQFRMQPHMDLVTSESDHGRGRFGLERNKRADVVELGSKVIDHLLGRLGRAAWAVDYQVQVSVVYPVADLHQGVDVFPLDVVR